MVGNIKGVSKVVADDLKVAAPAADAPPPVAAKAEFYTIKSGDTLSAIAKNYYGKASAYMRIVEANKEVITDPDKIFPGQKIRIPLD
jgi:nucleoid-associated protein YgaU